MPKYDIDEVKRAAAGRWKEILERVAGIPADLLDPRKEHPCPRCGGETRFRLVDEAVGAVLCSHCFNKRNGDGLSAVDWMQGSGFGKAVELVADFVNVKPKGGKKKTDPAKDLEFFEWAPQLAKIFCHHKPGVTPAAMQGCGTRMAKYKRQWSVNATPIIDQSLDVEKPSGWIVADNMGKSLPKFDREGNVTGHVKTKVTYGSKPGLCGTQAIRKMLTPGMVERVIKVEGVSDLFALTAIIPPNSKTVAVTNSNGATERPGWRAGFLSQFETIILHDADQPGEAGAKGWASEIAKAGGDVKIARLPYDVAEKHGKDLRDWLAKGNGFEALEMLIADAEVVIVKRDESGNVVADERVDTAVEQQICRELELEVLGETDRGFVRLFSMFHRKSVEVPDIGRLSYDKLLQIVGPPAKQKVHTLAEEIEGMYRFRDVRQAIATIAGYRRIDDHGIVGRGIWAGRDMGDNETGSIVLVNGTDAARYNGDHVLRRVVAPRVDGLLLDLDGAAPWFDHDELARHLASVKESTAFAERAIEEAESLFGRWRWKNQETDPMLVVGLTLASFVQTVWAWRPQVAISGETNCGKSYLFEALGGKPSHGVPGIFSTLAFKQAKSTEPGIRQNMGSTAQVIMCDEFENSKDRVKVLEMARNSSRGETTAKGTAGTQKGLQFHQQHIYWVAATETGLIDQPDRNRFVSFDLLRAPPGEHGKLVLPTPAELKSLGQRLLAVAVHHALRARDLAVRIKDTRRPGVDPRHVESYAVPAAILSCAVGYDEQQARSLLLDLMAPIEEDEQETDHDNLVADILSSLVFIQGKGNLSIGQILDSPGEYQTHSQQVEAKGVKLLPDGWLFIAARVVSKGILKGTQWDGTNIRKVLGRIPGADSCQRKINGKPLRGVAIPMPEGGEEPQDA